MSSVGDGLGWVNLGRLRWVAKIGPLSNSVLMYIIRPHRIEEIANMRAIVTDVSSYVCLCVLDITMRHAKTDELIKMSNGVWTREGPRNMGRINWGTRSPREGAILRGAPGDAAFHQFLLTVCIQMRWLICTKMASCLRMRLSAKPASPSPVRTGNNGVQPSEVTTNNRTTLLTVNTEIRDLLRAKLRSEAELQENTEEAEDRRQEWRLASAVIDRTLFIIFSMVSIQSGSVRGSGFESGSKFGSAFGFGPESGLDPGTDSDLGSDPDAFLHGTFPATAERLVFSIVSIGGTAVFVTVFACAFFGRPI